VNKEILNYAFRLLNRKDYTQKELKNKLCGKFNCSSESEIDEILGYLEGHNFLNDSRYAENYVYFRLKKGYGKKRIRHELTEKGINNELIEKALNNQDETVENVFLKKLKQLEGKKRKRSKLFDFMLRRGFEGEKIIELLNKYEVKDDENG